MNILSPVRQGLLPPQMKQTPNKDKKNPVTFRTLAPSSVQLFFLAESRQAKSHRRDIISHAV